MSILKATDFSDRRSQFESWLASPGRLGKGTRVLSLDWGTSGAGYSNRTIMAKVAQPDGKQSTLIARFGPSPEDPSLFPVYDIRKQFDIPTALARYTEVCVAPGLWFEEDPTMFGSPFFVMDFVPGRIPADEPPYALEGFVVDSTPEQQATMWWSSIDALIELAAVDPATLQVPSLRKPPAGALPLRQWLAELDEIYVWARGNSGPFPAWEQARVWLRDNMPQQQPLGMVWGDARFSNIIFDSQYRVKCLLDWELAAIGSPEYDLAYFLVFDEMSQDHLFAPLSAPRPPGFPSVAETISYYEQRTGIEIRNRAYYTCLALFKNITYFQRFCEMLFESGRLTREEAEALKMTSGPNVRWMSDIVDGIPLEHVFERTKVSGEAG